MNTKEKFKDIMSEMGFSSIETYSKWRSDSEKLKEDVETYKEQLSPNNIDNSKFWEASHDLFGCLPICGSAYNPKYNNRELANRLNLSSMLHDYGLLHNVYPFIEDMQNVLEIGPGYGNLKMYFEKHYSHLNYHGIDVCPLVEGVLKTDGKTIPEELKDKKYDLIVSANVFQHLSVEQRRSYYKEVADVISDDGVFVFYMPVECIYGSDKLDRWTVVKEKKMFEGKELTTQEDIEAVPSEERYKIYTKKENYLEHFGQLTKIQSIKEVLYDVCPEHKFCYHDVRASSSGICTFTFFKNPAKVHSFHQTNIYDIL
jgi:hypothetical protein